MTISTPRRIQVAAGIAASYLGYRAGAAVTEKSHRQDLFGDIIRMVEKSGDVVAALPLTPNSSGTVQAIMGLSAMSGLGGFLLAANYNPTMKAASLARGAGGVAMVAGGVALLSGALITSAKYDGVQTYRRR